MLRKSDAFLRRAMGMEPFDLKAFATQP
jgi:hypothetical protein